MAAVAASWGTVSTGPASSRRWLLGRLWNDTAMSTALNDDVAACPVLVDEFNFWSKFVDETRVPELGTRRPLPSTVFARIS